MTGLSRSTWTFFALCLIILLSGEAAARLAQHFSKFYRRVHLESHEAQLLRHATPRTILIAGNSLVRYGIDFDRLNQDLAGQFHSSRFVVEGSSYYDWYYGLQSLFRAGMRPDFVVLCLNSGFLGDKTPPDVLSAYLLFDPRAIRELAHDLHIGPTAETNLYFGHFSALFGAGPEIRSVLLARLINAPDIFDQLYPPVPPFPADPHFIPDVAVRLRALQDLSEANGSKFLYLIPPTREPGDTAVVSAAELAHVRALHPIANFALDGSNYLDGYHLNEKGAKTFTSAIAQELRTRNLPRKAQRSERASEDR